MLRKAASVISVTKSSCCYICYEKQLLLQKAAAVTKSSFCYVCYKKQLLLRLLQKAASVMSVTKSSFCYMCYKKQLLLYLLQKAAFVTKSSLLRALQKAACMQL
jgi:hypothetical protein